MILALISYEGTSDGQVVSLDDVKVKGDEFWDYDQQVDLEAFSTKDFFSTLSKQSSDVTSALAKQKDQVSDLKSGTSDFDNRLGSGNIVETIYRTNEQGNEQAGGTNERMNERMNKQRNKSAEE